MSDPQPIGSLTGTPIPPINASYTALIATLVILLTVASAIVGRSFVLRRRHRRLLDDPLREGGVTAGRGGGRLWTFGNDIGPEVRRGAVREKPKVWQTWIQNLGVVGKDSGRVALADIKPVSVAYIRSGNEEPPVEAPPLPLSASYGARRILSRRARPMESPTSTLPSRTYPSRLRVFVLVAMPTPESSSYFPQLRTDKDEDIDGLPRRVGGLPPIEMGAVEMVVHDD